jgi:pseudo-rSAM protein
LGFVELDINGLHDNETGSLIGEIVSKNMGKLAERKSKGEKFINLLPILNLQSDIDRLKENDEFTIGENLADYLNELTIYLNDSCNLSCANCEIFHKQTKSCHKTGLNNNLDVSVIRTLLDNLRYSNLKKINILGGDISQYSHIDHFFDLLSDYDFEFHIWRHYQNPALDRDCPGKTKLKYDVIVPLPLKDYDKKYLIENNTGKTLHFFIEDESQLADIEDMSGRIGNYNPVPIFTGANCTFFEENVYLAKEDIFDNPISHKTIFRNQKLNSNHFGKLYIMPDGDVRASPDTCVLGNIYDKSLPEIIYSELDGNTAWRTVRSAYQPCGDCLYRDLCPPLSNYERLIGQNNLCRIMHPGVIEQREFC